MGKPFPLDFAPGIVKTDAPYALRGRYIDCQHVRFVKGKPEKHRGHVMFSTVPVTGFARAALSWDDFSFNRRLAVGTHLKLYLLGADGVPQNITPFRSTGTLANDPFAVTSGSATVIVTHASHGNVVGSTVNFSGATAGGGITVDGEYLVTAVLGVNSYEIVHSVAASSTDATTGGAAVVFSYELLPGNANVQQGRGWGVGTWGTGFWGVPRESSTFTQYARTWSLDLYGENLLAMPSGSFLYQWDPDSSVRAEKVTNSPSGHFMFVTSERYPVILGLDDDMMTLGWPDQNDITIWTPAANNTALIRRLQIGSRLVAGAVLRNTLNILWSDSAAYSMQYTGRKNIIYETLPIAKQCGLIGPQAFVVARGVAFWMSNFNFHMYAGGVDNIPNSEDVRDWLFARLNPKQNWKCAAEYSSTHNEVRWQYVLDGQDESAYYVAVSLDDFSWTMGEDDRLVFEERSGINPGVYGVDAEGNVYQHEIGVDANGAAMSWFLESAPLDLEDGDRLIDAHGYIPNFQRQVGPIDITINGWDHPQQVTPIDTFTGSIAEQQGIVDMNMSGRQMSFRIAGSAVASDFRLGIGKVEIQGGAKRRASA
jgi:hypothetical protein